MHDNQKDLTLIDCILTGDQFAYRALINRHKAYAFTIAYRILGSREDAEEVAKDAFMNAFRALSNFSRESKFSTWFYRIVFNAAVGHKRKNRIATQQIEYFTLSKLGMAHTTDNLKLHEHRLFIQKVR